MPALPPWQAVTSILYDVAITVAAVLSFHSPSGELRWTLAHPQTTTEAARLLNES